MGAKAWVKAPSPETRRDLPVVAHLPSVSAGCGARASALCLMALSPPRPVPAVLSFEALGVHSGKSSES